MGQFSWLDCITQAQIVDGKRRNSYVLIPQTFGGGHIEEKCYEGYGIFGGKDIYDLVAEWNQDHITAANLRQPNKEDYSEDKYYQNALERYDLKVRRLSDFTNYEPSSVMKEKYGDEYLRLIGIDIACYDEQNCMLRYPIKITHDPNAVYEWCAPSKADPNQGWEY